MSIQIVVTVHRRRIFGGTWDGNLDFCLKMLIVIQLVTFCAQP